MRLLKVHKENIWYRVNALSIEPKRMELSKLNKEFFDKLHASILSKESFQLLKQCPKRTQVQNHYKIKDDSLGSRTSSTAYPAWAMHNRGFYFEIHYGDLNPQLKAAYKQLIKASNDLEAFVEKLQLLIDNLLKSVTTVKKLREIWPEGDAIINYAIGFAPTQHFPAVLNVKEINAMIPLPLP